MKGVREGGGWRRNGREGRAGDRGEGRGEGRGDRSWRYGARMRFFVRVRWIDACGDVM